MNYRQEIDGLRTIAVVAVVIYHAAFSLGAGIWLPGGFIGVDIFFVISGYLITSIILAQESEGRFSLGQFYASRIRRIVPALAVMVLLIIPLGWRFMLPGSFENLANSALGALGYYSNFVFAFEDAYNAEASTLKPLLHTWSLSVEGQFYVVFPLVMIALLRTRASQHLFAIFALLIGASIIAAVFLSGYNQTLNFFLLPSRSWELLAGSALALAQVMRGKRDTPDIIAMWLPSAGMIAIIASFLFFDDSMRLPDALTLLPIAGTMAIIWAARPGELITEFLSLRPVVYIGKISYSLYLWHFPVFVFQRISGFGFETYVEKLIGIAIAAILSVISYYLIERPFRNRQIMSGRVFAAIMVAILSFGVGVQSYIMKSGGAPHRLGELATLFDQATPIEVTLGGRSCHNRRLNDLCRFKGKSESIILIGDSHAKAISGALLGMTRENDWEFIPVTMDGCPLIAGLDRPVTDNPYWTEARRQNCLNKSKVLDKSLKVTSPSTIIYFSRMPYYATSEGFKNREGAIEVIPGGMSVVVDKTEYPDINSVAEVFPEALKRFMSYGHQVVVVYPYPEMGWQVPQTLREKLGKFPISKWAEVYPETFVSVSLKVTSDRTASTLAALDKLPDNGRTLRVKPADWLCKSETGRCYANGPEGLYYYDDDHPSMIGARLIADKIEEQIKTAPPLRGR